MPKNKKIGILLLFASGVVCILFSVLRVAQVASNASKPEVKEMPLDPTWLAIWGMVESSIGTSAVLSPGGVQVVAETDLNSRHYWQHARARDAGERIPLEVETLS